MRSNGKNSSYLNDPTLMFVLSECNLRHDGGQFERDATLGVNVRRLSLFDVVRIRGSRFTGSGAYLSALGPVR